MVFKIYVLGFIVALFYISFQFIEYCVKNRMDYTAAFSDYNILSMIILESLGSWLTVIVCFLTRNAK